MYLCMQQGSAIIAHINGSMIVYVVYVSIHAYIHVHNIFMHVFGKPNQGGAIFTLIAGSVILIVCVYVRSEERHLAY